VGGAVRGSFLSVQGHSHALVIVLLVVVVVVVVIVFIIVVFNVVDGSTNRRVGGD
jgi:hypothetical protein